MKCVSANQYKLGENSTNKSFGRLRFFHANQMNFANASAGTTGACDMLSCMSKIALFAGTWSRVLSKGSSLTQ